MSCNISGSLISASLLAAALLGCQPGGVGDPCTPEDEYLATFSGFQLEEVNVESRSFQCETRICLVNHFQGRVSCPYGTTSSEKNIGRTPVQTPPQCVIPGSDVKVTATVDPQLIARRAADSVYCSCRCNGPDAGARYCECPSGFTCSKLVDDYSADPNIGKGGQLAGSYCIRENTEYRVEVPKDTCAYKDADGNSNCQAVDTETGEPTD
jgi:hypothetical protein